MNQLANELKQLKNPRKWVAKLGLAFECRSGKTKLVSNTHVGPLRVLKPYYPERDGPCHVYLLHPPGGLVVGDQLIMVIDCAVGSHALLTTPSAGKVYTTAGDSTSQSQSVCFSIGVDAVLEWLPQETIVYNGANVELVTRFDLAGNARLCAWDVVCLGRPASNECFSAGRCKQSLQVYRDGRAVFLERNDFVAHSDLMLTKWGLNGNSTVGTMLVSVVLSRALIDDLYDLLSQLGADHQWGMSQRGELFIARYMGCSAEECRRGFNVIWTKIRPLFNGRVAVEPRIWKT